MVITEAPQSGLDAKVGGSKHIDTTSPVVVAHYDDGQKYRTDKLVQSDAKYD